MKMRLAFTAATLCCVSVVRGDEQLFGFVRGAETGPAHRSGVAWTYWTYLAGSPDDFETTAKAWVMKIHGAAAMAVLVLIGTLLSGHVRFAWRARRNRANGSVFLSVFAVLTVTGYGLYYAGGEMLREWTSWIHLVVGLALPILLLIHIFLGRRTRPSGQSRTDLALRLKASKIDLPSPIISSPNAAFR